MLAIGLAANSGRIGNSGKAWAAVQARPYGSNPAHDPNRANSDAMSFQGEVARATGLEPATSGVTGRHSNRLSYARA